MSRLRRVATFAAAETVGRAATWLTVFVLPWFLTPDEYGIVVLLATFEGVATGLLMLGQDRAVMWRVAAQVEPEQQQWVGTAVGIVAVTSLAGFGFVGCVSLLGVESFLGVPVWPHLWLLTVAVVCLNVNRVVLALVRVTGRVADFAAYRIATGVGRLIVTLGLAGISGSSIAFPAGGVLGTAGGGSRLWRKILRGVFDRTSFGRRNITSMLAYGAPLSLHALAGNTMMYVDRWIIGSMLGLAVVGSYGWYYMLGSGVVFVYASLNVYYEPAIYRECRQSGSVRSLQEFLGLSMMAAGAYSLIGAGIASVGGGLIPDAVEGDPAITRVVLVAHWFHPLYLAANYLLSAFGRTMRIAAMSSGAVLVVLAANLILIPMMGAIGGAWATLAGTLSLVTAAGVMVRHLRLGARFLLGPTFALFVLGGGGIFLPGVAGLAVASTCLIGYGVLYVRRLQISTAED